MKDADEESNISVAILETVTGMNKMAELDHNSISQSVEQVVTATAANGEVLDYVDEESLGVKQCRVLLKKLKADKYKEATVGDGPGVEQMTGAGSIDKL